MEEIKPIDLSISKELQAHIDFAKQFTVDELLKNPYRVNLMVDILREPLKTKKDASEINIHPFNTPENPST